MTKESTSIERFENRAKIRVFQKLGKTPTQTNELLKDANKESSVSGSNQSPYGDLRHPLCNMQTTCIACVAVLILRKRVALTSCRVPLCSRGVLDVIEFSALPDACTSIDKMPSYLQNNQFATLILHKHVHVHNCCKCLGRIKINAIITEEVKS